MARNRPPGKVSPIQGVGLTAADPAGRAFGASDRTLRQIGRYQNPEIIANARGLVDDVTADFESFAATLNAPSPRFPNPQTGAFAAQQAIAGTGANSLKALNAAAAKARQLGYDVTVFSDASGSINPAYDPKDEDYYVQRSLNEDYTGTAMTDALPGVPLSDIPTSTTNYRRPRTVAAGYDPETRTVTVVFRDGTFYNYYDVPPTVWIKFHTSLSKGPMLNRANRKQGFDGDLLKYRHGPADISALSPVAKEFLYTVARTAQIYYREKSTGYTPQNARPKQRRNLYKAQDRLAQEKARKRLGINPSQRRTG